MLLAGENEALDSAEIHGSVQGALPQPQRIQPVLTAGGCIPHRACTSRAGRAVERQRSWEHGKSKMARLTRCGTVRSLTRRGNSPEGALQWAPVQG